jgi:glycosyltransferase involved in cell wall biosynthesis
MGKICIVLSGQLGNAPRTVKEAGALSAAGHDVTVIAHQVNNAVEPRDQEILRTATWQTIRVPFDYQSVRWKLLRLRQMAFQHAFGVAGAGALALRGISAYTPDLTRAARKFPADLYIAHYSPALPAAAAAAAAHSGLYAFDAEDFHPGDLPDEQSQSLYNRTLDSVDRRLLPGCAYVSAAAPGIADLYAETYRVPRPAVVLNVFPKANAPVVSTPAGTASPGPSLYWFSQIIGANRGLECAVRALPLMKSRPHLYIRGIPREGFVRGLMEMADNLGVLDRLRILEPAMPDDLERLGAKYDIGLCAEVGDSPNRRVALPNKLFSYLASGLPILATDIPGHAGLARQLKGAMALFQPGNHESLAVAADAILSSPERLAAARETAWRLAQQSFNWETRQAVLIETVNRALDRKAPIIVDPRNRGLASIDLQASVEPQPLESGNA